ncbi:MAG: WYL domain-containing protein [Actinobacteria bacterium]|nr:WYL domain-containing protein [Actinomycetota bacterium]
MNRTERLYAIVEELRVAGPSGRTAGWLADRFEVSTRTIKRDVRALEQADVPIWSVDGRGGGYRLQRSAALPPLSFTAGEATAIAVALAAEPSLPFGPDGRTALAKVLGAMDDTQRRRTDDLASRIWMGTTAGDGRPAAARILDEALRASLVVHLDYRDAEGRGTRSRPVEPLAFARTGGHWYLLGWCREREAGRWFRMDRIQDARATREQFPPRDLHEVFGAAPDDAHPVDIQPRTGTPRTPTGSRGHVRRAAT